LYTYEKSTFINRPQQEVWDYISNPANSTQWHHGTESAEWTSEGEPGVGSTIGEVGKFMGLKVKASSKIVVWNPPNELSRKSVGGKMPFVGTIKLEPKENGTQLTLSGTAEFPGFLMRLFEGLVSKNAEKQTSAHLVALKSLLEPGPA
jgi:carbon monoxide dehydrogenase subunit G